MAQRKVILHYHIFKNAGTSIDRMLQASFGERWLNYDKPDAGGKISALEMEEFMLDHADIAAFSSHQVVPPPPSRRIQVYPIVILRHPIDRAFSAYLFEWQKQQGTHEPIGSFAEYVSEKFQYPRKNAIEDFQVFHLANHSYDDARSSENLNDEDVLQCARDLLSKVGYFGIVDNYNESIRNFKKILSPHFPDMIFDEYHENQLQDETLTISDKVERIRNNLDSLSYTSLVMRNQLDLRLYEYALGLFAKIRRSRVK